MNDAWDKDPAEVFSRVRVSLQAAFQDVILARGDNTYKTAAHQKAEAGATEDAGLATALVTGGVGDGREQALTSFEAAAGMGSGPGEVAANGTGTRGGDGDGGDGVAGQGSGGDGGGDGGGQGSLTLYAFRIICGSRRGSAGDDVVRFVIPAFEPVAGAALHPWALKNRAE